MALTAPVIITRVLTDARDWVPGYKLVNNQTLYGWIGSSGDRQARRMAKRGEIERRIIDGYAHYRTVPQQQRMKL